jgi:hypothetical protein
MNRIVTTAAATIIGGFALLALGACNADLAGSSLAASHESLVGATSAANSDIFAGQKVSGSTATTDEPLPSPERKIAVPSSKAPTGPGSAGSTVPHTGGARNTVDRTGTSGGNTTGAAVTTSNPSPTATEGTATTASQESNGSGEPASDNTEAPTTGTETQQSTGSSGNAAVTQHQSSAPRINSASISCEYAESDTAYHAFLSYEVVNATGMALSIDNPGIVGSFGTYDWHGTIEIPSNGCYASYGEQTYSLYTVGGTGPQASRTITRTGTYTAITPPPFSTPTTHAPIPTPAPYTASDSTPSATGSPALGSSGSDPTGSAGEGAGSVSSSATTPPGTN